MIHICLRQPRQVVQTKPTRKVEKKRKKRALVDHRCKQTANNSGFEENAPFEARVSAFLRKFTSKLQVLYARKPCIFPEFVQNS